MRACREFSQECEASVMRHPESFVFLYDALVFGPHASERIRPIDNRELTTLLQDTYRFIKHLYWMFNLEQHVRYDDEIDALVADLRPARCFKIAPHDVHPIDFFTHCIVLNARKKVFLHIDGIYPARMSHGTRRGECVCAGTGAEVGDLHPWIDAHCNDIRFGIRKVTA